MTSRAEDPVLRVAAAARRTLAEGSARVWHRACSERPGAPERTLLSVSDGIADLTRQRVLVSVEAGPGWQRLADVVLERFPWLDDGPGDADCEDEGVFKVYAGTAVYFGAGERWHATSEGDPEAGQRSADDPLWILEALTVVGGADQRRREPELVRGDPCHRLSFVVDPRRHATELELPQPLPILGRLSDTLAGLSHRLAGEVWIDDRERVRRVSWTRVVARRPRWPFKAPEHRLWHTTELWDFGTEARIEIPTATSPDDISPREIFAVLGALWRRKRAYDRRHGG